MTLGRRSTSNVPSIVAESVGTCSDVEGNDKQASQKRDALSYADQGRGEGIVSAGQSDAQCQRNIYFLRDRGVNAVVCDPISTTHALAEQMTNVSAVPIFCLL